MTIITAAPTCIHAEPCRDWCYPVAIVTADIFAAAREWKREHWHEFYGVNDGYSDPIPRESQLYTWMLAAYQVATSGSDEPGAWARGKFVWLRTPDYVGPRWIANPAYTEWQAGFDSLDPDVPAEREQRRAMLTPDRPHMGHWSERRGDCLCFLTLEGEGRLSFCG